MTSHRTKSQLRFCVFHAEKNTTKPVCEGKLDVLSEEKTYSQRKEKESNLLNAISAVETNKNGSLAVGFTFNWNHFSRNFIAEICSLWFQPIFFPPQGVVINELWIFRQKRSTNWVQSNQICMKSVHWVHLKPMSHC